MRVKPGIGVFILLFFSLDSEGWAQQTLVKYKGEPYPDKLLQRALDVTSEQGKTTLTDFPSKPTEERGIGLIEDGQIDVSFLSWSSDREKRLRMVPIEIMRGILGYRLLLVKTAQRQRFSRVTTLAELSRLSAGFGAQWADLPILKSNGLKVIEVSDTALLAVMLENKRFDYFPRGINEVWENLDEMRLSAPDVVIAPKIALYYPFAVYFFVSKSHQALADRIQRGLEILMRTGEFKKMFLQEQSDAIRKADLPSRKLLRLENPLLRQDLVVDTSWWLSSDN